MLKFPPKRSTSCSMLLLHHLFNGTVNTHCIVLLLEVIDQCLPHLEIDGQSAEVVNDVLVPGFSLDEVKGPFQQLGVASSTHCYTVKSW